MGAMSDHKVFQMSFTKLYDLLLNKAVRKGRTKAEEDEVICWLTGYSAWVWPGSCADCCSLLGLPWWYLPGRNCSPATR